jgi:hypothetical protein
VDKLILLFLCLRLCSVGRGAKLFQIQISKTREKPQCSLRTIQNYGPVFNVLPQACNLQSASIGPFALAAKKKGHSAQHCKAQWRKIGKKAQFDHAPAKEKNPASGLKRNGASTSKNPNRIPGKNSLPSATPNSSSPLPCTELNLAGSAESTLTHTSLPSPTHSFNQATMAYQRADPQPFAPNGFHALEIQHREVMARAVVQHHQATHEDFAIVSFNPLPANTLHFPAVHEVVHEYLEEHMNVQIRDIQPSHLGQALVRFVHVHDRDSLVNNSPHPYGEVNFNLVRHNQGRNWRAMNFNRDCWLMLLGFPLDHWNNVSIQSAIASFGKVVIWENDRTNLARLLVRAQVTDLQDVPHFIVLSESEGFLGHSWTVQCKILEQ